MTQKNSDFGYVMGIQCFANQDSGACLLRFSKDGKVLDYMAISEERLIRKKHPYQPVEKGAIDRVSLDGET